MITDDLPEGPKPLEAERFRATKPEDLVPFLERLKDQEFRLADLVYRREEKAVDLLVERIHPPDRGTWALRIAGVESWLVEHQAIHETDTLKDLRIVPDGDPRKRRIVLKCVLDQMTAVVRAVDLRLVKIGLEKGAAVRYEDLPKWFRQEVQEIHNEKTREEERVVRARRDIRRLALYWGGGGFFFTPLLLLSLGSALGVWLKGEEDLRVKVTAAGRPRGPTRRAAGPSPRRRPGTTAWGRCGGRW